MAKRHTRRLHRINQRAGFHKPANRERVSAAAAELSAGKKGHVVHALSQLKRFSACLKEKPLRAYQFFYNLGRLQELLGETTHPEIWWKPVEGLVAEDKYEQVASHIDVLKELIGVDYDIPLVAKGC